jgi:hypothetical protein
MEGMKKEWKKNQKKLLLSFDDWQWMLFFPRDRSMVSGPTTNERSQG